MQEARIDRFEKDGKKCFLVAGADFDTPALFILHESSKVILAKCPGRMAWGGRFAGRTYCKPEYIIFKKIEENKVENNTGSRTFEYSRETRGEVYKKAYVEFKMEEKK